MKIIVVVLMSSLLTSSLCQVDCASKPHTSGNDGPYKCVCVSGFWWDGLNCQINCSSVSESTGEASNLDSCFCVDGYTWMSSGCGINCSEVPHSLPTIGRVLP